MYYILSVGGMIIVRCTEYRGCPLLGGSLSINAMLNSIRVIDFVRCTEVVRFSECPLWEVPLYTFLMDCTNLNCARIVQWIVTNSWSSFHRELLVYISYPMQPF